MAKFPDHRAANVSGNLIVLPDTGKSGQVVSKSASSALIADQEDFLDNIKPLTVAGPEDTGIHAHKLNDNPNAHFSDKIYMFPESYNQLRRELSENWPNLWAAVSYNMAFAAEDFVSTMNEALDMRIQFDGNRVDATCTVYLNELRRLRGLAGFSVPKSGE